MKKGKGSPASMPKQVYFQTALWSQQNSRFSILYRIVNKTPEQKFLDKVSILGISLYIF